MRDREREREGGRERERERERGIGAICPLNPILSCPHAALEPPYPQSPILLSRVEGWGVRVDG